MNWLKKLFGDTPDSSEKQTPQSSGAHATKPTEMTSVHGGDLLIEVDSFSGLQDLGKFLKRHSEKEILSFIDTFPFDKLKIDVESISKDFRNSRRFEMILFLARILLKWDDYLSDPEWKNLLPDSLNASSAYDKLRSRLITFLKPQDGKEIAMHIRTQLYEFAMDLIRTEKNRDALLCLEVSRPSLKEDHDFWRCVCYHNIGLTENDIAIVKQGIQLTEEILSGAPSSNSSQKLRQSNMLEKLKKMEGDYVGSQKT